MTVDKGYRPVPCQICGGEGVWHPDGTSCKKYKVAAGGCPLRHTICFVCKGMGEMYAEFRQR